MVLTFGSVDEILQCLVLVFLTRRVLFITLYRVILSLKSVDEILNCDLLSESY